MSARPKLAPADQMTIAEFLGFTETRPDEERWELIEGVPVLDASPIDHHQIVAGNILAHLLIKKAAISATWLPLLGIGTRVPAAPNSLLQPDVFVLEGAPNGTSTTADALVIFEVLSKSNSTADQSWRKRVYASVPNCQHYVTVSMMIAEVVTYDRATSWTGRKTSGLKAFLELPALATSLPLVDIYRYTPIG